MQCQGRTGRGQRRRPACTTGGSHAMALGEGPRAVCQNSAELPGSLGRFPGPLCLADSWWEGRGHRDSAQPPPNLTSCPLADWLCQPSSSSPCLLMAQFYKLKKTNQPNPDFPGGPVVKTLCFHYVGMGSIPGQGSPTCSSVRPKNSPNLFISEWL